MQSDAFTGFFAGVNHNLHTFLFFPNHHNFLLVKSHKRLKKNTHNNFPNPSLFKVQGAEVDSHGDHLPAAGPDGHWLHCQLPSLPLQADR